ncbi:MAG: hypothetical protein A2020_09920 [Lentisphaerae bacterium GWF2_45_14]|nr:MAG: hypothetical protein A2020_09920 [Lentisphaerae bacterium GWF2_45_14]
MTTNAEQLEEQKNRASKTLATMLDYLGLDASLKAELQDDKIQIIVQSEDAGRIIGRKGQALESLQTLLNRMMFKGDPEFPRIYIDIDGYSRKSRSYYEDRPPRGEGRSRNPRNEGRERSPRGPSEQRSRDNGRDNDRDNERDNYRDNRRDSYRDNNDNGGDDGDFADEETIRQQAMDAAKEVKRWGEPVTLPAMSSKERRVVHITLQDDTELKTESEGDGSRKKVVISLK